MYETKFKTLRHIETVRNFLNHFAMELLKCGENHDQCKLQPPEIEVFDEFTKRLRGVTYGSPEYNEFLSGMKPALDHHYAKSRHHPEWENYNVVEWKDIKGYNGVYQISNHGDIRNKNGVIKSYVTPKGYLRIQLSNDGDKKNHLVHRLVGEHFLENEDNNPQINHKDTNKKNNYYENLEWVNNSENQLHAYNTGLQKIKYIVHCVELDIITFGCGDMERKLKDLGYDDARESTILSCINNTSSHHMDLHFDGYNIEDYERSKISNMNLIDLIEMVCDWKASSLRQNDGDIYQSLKVNKDRFNISDDVYNILINTIKRMEKMDVKHHAEES